ncbi:uncharacterized protein CLUP02_09929 [Colletotrichum lupini]|uniref:Uncharacterized protein n=1 Tax=Colletotrichum lupini TaxID=145971 RepID=A0A9Q8SVP0_9PEZI|nr:uncharacterized protein CLUP02_09929 [Colletotrichum lupini]UQC84432.1 hypothetical protein CLUP02_09929 [Colletotrichum lupini]
MFTLRDLQQIGDFIIQPTDNIFEHLLVRRHKDRETRLTLYVFFHVSALKKLRYWNLTRNGSHFNDPKFLDETIQTLALLLPRNDAKSLKWFKTYCEKFQRSLPSPELNGIDPKAGLLLPVGSKRAEDYNYWLSRLMTLEKEYENYSPRTLRQFMRARRRYRDWTIYWVTVTALLLALISTAAGIVSAFVGGFALKKDKNGNKPITAACCCRNIDHITSTVAVASEVPASASGMTLEPAHIIDPSHTMVVTVSITTTITVAGA